MRSPLVVIDDIILATPSSSQSMLQKPHWSQGMTLVIRKIVGKQTALRFFNKQRWIGPEKRPQTSGASSEPSPAGERKIPVDKSTFHFRSAA
jgi:hypothetical protein